MKWSSFTGTRLGGISAIVLSILLGAAYFYLTRGTGNSPTDQPSAATKSHRSHADKFDSPLDSHIVGADAIEFSKELWNSAGIKIKTIEMGALPQSIRLTGKVALNEDKLAHVFPLVDGRVEEVRVSFGQQVKKGDLLVVVLSKEVGQAKLQLFQDRMKLEFAETKNRWVQEVSKNSDLMIKLMREGSKIEEVELALKDLTMGEYREKLMSAYIAQLKAKAQMQRLSPLSSSGAVPARQISEAESELNATRAGLQSLLEQSSQDIAQASRLAAQSIKELQTTISVSETNLKILGFDDKNLVNIDPAKQGERLAHYPVVAPFDGTVISKDVVLMERAGPDRQIMTIADLSTVWVTADIYEMHLPLLAQLGDRTIQFQSEAWPEDRFEARIFYTGDVVQESTRTIALRAIALNDRGLLKPGMFVTVELPDLATGDVLHVPLASVQDYEGQSFVFVQAGDELFARHDVTLGRRNQVAVEIRSGLQSGDRVVVDGGFALKSKMLAALLAE